MPDPFASALPILFSGPGAEAISFHARDAAAIAGINAIRNVSPAGDVFGAGRTRRRVEFELLKTDVPDRPGKNDWVAAADGDWFVKEVVEPIDMPIWIVTVERSGQ